MKYLYFPLFLCFLTIAGTKSDAQALDERESRWIRLFSGGNLPGVNPANAETWLIRIPTSKINWLLHQPGVKVLRRLSGSHFVMEAQPGWLQANRHLFDLVVPANANWKLSDRILSDPATLASNLRLRFCVTVNHSSLFDTVLNHYPAEITLINRSAAFNIFTIECSFSSLEKYLVGDENVLFIESGDRSPKNESLLSGYDNSLNTLNSIQADYPTLNGVGLVVSVKEDMFDTTDMDLRGRIVPTTIGSTTFSSHANDMATIIAGAGNSFASDRGAAWAAGISSADFANLLPDMTAYNQYHISVQNHSYGTAIENYYGSDAAAYDSSMIVYPALVHVFSSGNSGDSVSAGGAYSGIPGYANLTGSFKQAKNILTVGSTDSFGVVSPLSSKGPAYDGRVKPELVAFGVAGSSEASAIGSGTALLLQSAYAGENSGKLPDNSLVKAIMINSADDVGPKGIDFSSGYGSINAWRSVRNILAGNFFTGSVGQGQSAQYQLTIPANAQYLKLTLVWDDPPAEPLAPASLVNDLDLTLTPPGGAQILKPWVLNSFPQLDSITALPVRSRDSLNVVEQISLDSPSAGIYVVTVNGFNVIGSGQPFYVAYQWDTLNTFTWTYPTKVDFFEIGGTSALRWKSHYSDGTTGKLEYSLDSGSSWMTINDAVPLAYGFYQWGVPDTFATAILRMTVGSTTYPSQLFAFGSPLYLRAGFDCTDSILLYWNRITGADSFDVYSMDGNYLARAGGAVDTAVILAKKEVGYPYFAVAPVLPYHTAGIKSYTINATLLNVGCYVESFLANLQPAGNSAALSLLLGSDYNVSQIYFEKLTSGGWKNLATIQPAAGELSFSATDDTLTVGANTYRASIQVLNKNIYSDAVSIYTFGTADFIIFPNPARRGQAVQLLTKNLPSPYMLRIYDMLGRQVSEQTINNFVQTISLQNICSGTYVVVVQDSNKILFREKIIIL
jgi:hypothetical protein